jgi:hypothetical protein
LHFPPIPHLLLHSTVRSVRLLAVYLSPFLCHYIFLSGQNIFPSHSA